MYRDLLLAISVTFFFVVATPATADPVAMPNQFPLALPHWSLRPDSAQIVTHGDTFVRENVFWSNTSIRKHGVTIDAETFVSETTYRYGFAESFDIEVIVPIVYRGGGMLDSVIKQWDSAIGQANEKRENTADDQHRIYGRDEDRNSFRWDDSGTELGNVPVSLRYSLPVSEFDATVFATVQLPTSRGTFGADGIDSAVGTLLEWQSEPFTIHAGAAVGHYSDRSIEGILYSPFHVDLFAGATFRFSASWSTYLGLVYFSQVIDNLAHYPNESLYLDVAVAYQPDTPWRIEVFCRENPLYSSQSTDVTIGLGIRWEFS